MSTANGAPLLDIQGGGFELYLPPTPFRSQLVMLDYSTETFYSVNYRAAAQGDETPWSDLGLETITDPAILFQPEQSERLENGKFATGFLVSILDRQADKFVARKLGLVNVGPLPEYAMNWAALQSKKGEELKNEMRAGLMKYLWNRRQPAEQALFPYQTPGSVLNSMPRQWHIDGAALNHELDYIFAAGEALPLTQCWGLKM